MDGQRGVEVTDALDALVLLDHILDEMEKAGTITREQNNTIYTAFYNELYPGEEEE